MGKRAEVEEAERLLLIKECLAKRMRIREAARRAGVHPSTIEKWISHYEAEEEAGLQDRNKAQKSYDEETKRKAVADYLSGGGSLLSIARRYSIRSKNLLLRWIRAYNSHGESTRKEGGKAMARKTYTLEERLQAVKAHLEQGKSIWVIAAEKQAEETTVRTWIKKYQAMGIAGLEDRRGQRTAQQTPRTPEEELRVRNAQLEREIYLLKMENDLLKKVKELERGKD